MQVDERVGVLLVHGIGEQRRFQHLESEVRSLASAIEQAYGQHGRVTVQITPGSSSAFQADRESWRCDRCPPVQVLMRRPDGKTMSIGFHEVWWADLDEPATVMAQIRFWFWGLSMWAVAGRFRALPDGFQQMRLPGPARTVPHAPGDPAGGRDGGAPGLASRSWLRARLLLVAAVFATGTATISMWNFVLRRLGFGYFPGSQTFVNYLGDLKLYRQERRADGGPLYDLDQPPRVSIRRRMVSGVVDLATTGYDRWYILAHSLGTVVAFNALMEPGHCLPNYIDPQRWSRLCRRGMAGAARPGSPGEPEDWLPKSGGSGARMMPRRPMWLRDEDVIYREKLFAGLRGFLTYGSPLDKFASIWPALVPLNKTERVFQQGCEWVNVSDPCDPVAGSLDFFDPEQKAGSGGLSPLKVDNYCYRASSLLLRGHTRYMHSRPGREGDMIHSVAQWLVEGSRFSDVARSTKRWLDANGPASRVLAAWRLLQWVILGVSISAATVLLFAPFLRDIGDAWLSQTPSVMQSIYKVVGAAFTGGLIHDALVVFLLSMAICVACGLARYVFVPEEHDPNGRKRRPSRLVVVPPASPGPSRPDVQKAA